MAINVPGMRTSSALASFLVVCLGVACGDSTSTGGGGSGAAGGGSEGGGGSPTEGGGGAGMGGAPVECEEPTPMPGTTNDVLVDMVTITADDETGAAITDVNLQLCGTDGCLYSTTNALGQATFNNDLSSETIDRPTVKPGDSLVFGKIGWPWAVGSPSPFPVMFPRMEDSGQQMDRGASVSAGGVTLDIADDLNVTIDTLTYDEPAKQTFRAAQVPEAMVEAVTGDAAFVMVFTLGPVDTLFCPTGVDATFENYAGLDADTPVEIFGQELAVGEYFGGYGEWTKIADGVVSSDGSVITTTGDGLPALLTVAIRPAL